MKRMTFTLVLGVMTVALGLLGVSGAEAVSCADTLGPGGSFTFTADLGPCGGGVALIVVGPTTVDLAGHTVSCISSSTQGIIINGSGAVLKNGRVTGCGDGVEVLGSGGHQVRKVLADHNGVRGFFVNSANNTLTDNGAVANPNVGFHFDNSNSNTVKGNTAVSNGVDGFALDISNANSLSGNTAAKNGNHGFNLFLSAHNSLHLNTATDNRFIGFVLGGNSSSNIVASNKAFANGTRGISVGNGSTHNSISSNVALGNPAADDLADLNGSCDSNKWTGNLFGTSSQACIH